MIPGTRSQLPNFENFCSGRIFLPDIFAGTVILAVKTKTEPGDEEAKPKDEIVELKGVSSHVGVGELRIDVDNFIEKISELPKVGEIIGHDDRRAQSRNCSTRRGVANLLRKHLKLRFSIGSAYGSRTRVPALRGLCPNH